MLSALIWLPFLGALLIGCWPESWNRQRLHTVALIILAIVGGITGLTLGSLDISQGIPQLQETLPWLEQIGLSYHLAIDGISLPLIVLNVLLTALAVYSSDREIERPRLYYSLILILNGAVTGAFLSQNLLLFFLFYEAELIPLYLLIAIWGGARRSYAAMKFLIYTAISGILMLAAFLGLVLLTGADSFDYTQLQASTLPVSLQVVLLVTLLIAFGIKIPLFPFHTWLPDAHVEASTPISVLLAGVLLKLGTYGLLRFAWGLFPEAWANISPYLATWAVVSVLYGSFTAIAQTDCKKMVAYSSIGHMGYVLLALAASTPVSVVGSVLQMVSHGLISAQLFLLVGVVYTKTGTRDLTVLRGLLNPERGLPIVGTLMILGAMASAGIPGMVGFIAEFLTFRGSFQTFPTQTLISMIGSGLTSVYFLLLINRAFFGRLAPGMESLPKVTWGERFSPLLLGVLIILLGVQPSWLVNWSQPAIASSLRDRPITLVSVAPPRNAN
jgi:NAD(P)H-quinone oxidoreductase subunit 4